MVGGGGVFLSASDFIKHVHWCCYTFLLLSAASDLEGRENQRDLNELSSEANVESMLVVERGLRELATLKVPSILTHLQVLQIHSWFFFIFICLISYSSRFVQQNKDFQDRESSLFNGHQELILLNKGGKKLDIYANVFKINKKHENIFCRN